MAWRWPGDKPLSDPMMVSLLTHICVTRPQWWLMYLSTHNMHIASPRDSRRRHFELYQLRIVFLQKSCTKHQLLLRKSFSINGVSGCEVDSHLLQVAITSKQTESLITWVKSKQYIHIYLEVHSTAYTNQIEPNCFGKYDCRDHSEDVFSQWETKLHCNVLSRLLSPYPEGRFYDWRFDDWLYIDHYERWHCYFIDW